MMQQIICRSQTQPHSVCNLRGSNDTCPLFNTILCIWEDPSCLHSSRKVDALIPTVRYFFIICSIGGDCKWPDCQNSQQWVVLSILYITPWFKLQPLEITNAGGSVLAEKQIKQIKSNFHSTVSVLFIKWSKHQINLFYMCLVGVNSTAGHRDLISRT